MKTQNKQLVKVYVDGKFHKKMFEHKCELEMDMGKSMTWEEYIKVLFGMAK